MEEQTQVSEIYLKGFNHGYTIQQHQPELAEQILNSSDGPEEYLTGFKDGGKQYTHEMEHGRDASTPGRTNPGMDMER